MALVLKLLRANFRDRDWQRGQGYQRTRRVTRCEVTQGDDGHAAIDSEVHGSASNTYQQQVRITLENGKLLVAGQCTCPVGQNCKHVAAVCMHAARQLAQSFGLPGRADRIAAMLPGAGADEAGFDVDLSLAGMVAGAGVPAPGTQPGALAGTPPGSQAPAQREPASPRDSAAREAQREAQREQREMQRETQRHGGNSKESATDVRLWLDRLTHTHEASLGESNGYPPQVRERIVYTLAPSFVPGGRTALLRAFQLRFKKDGGRAKPTPYPLAQLAVSDARFVLGIDREIGRLAPGRGPAAQGVRLDEHDSAALLRWLMATRRCYWEQAGRGPALRPGPARKGTISWEADATGVQECLITVEPPAPVLPLTPPQYVDLKTGECGPIDCGVPDELSGALAQAPRISPETVALVSETLSNVVNGHAVPLPAAIEVRPPPDLTPTPVLTLISLSQPTTRLRQGGEFHCARLTFRYGPELNGTHAGSGANARLDSGRPSGRSGATRGRGDPRRTAPLNPAFEKATAAQMRQAGFISAEKAYGPILPSKLRKSFALPRDADWIEAMKNHLPRWREEGWQITMESGFAYDLVEVDEWYGEIEEGRPGQDWFGLDLGIEVAGERFSLVDLLLKALREHGPNFFEPVDESDAGKPILLPLPNGRRVMLPRERLTAIVALLQGLFGAGDSNLPPKTLSRYDVGRLAALDSALALRWHGGERLREIASRLAGFRGVETVEPPKGMNATLRGYQQDGVGWLQSLREYGLAGVLADDMGLGKTLQTIAHLLIEKEAGRLTEPALVVAPTSVIHNWAAEMKKFAPSMKVLVLHGKDRAEDFDKIKSSDLVITSYALLPRDEEVLQKQHWHIVVLDEAQNIKNAKTKAAISACALESSHRLCLSGTPLENNLGELWSLFRFLMPGFLGDEAKFKVAYRTPIETHGDGERAALLVSRVRPFLLRRTKDQVASELPPKTEVVREVEFQPVQRDLYETVRAAMDKRVRDEIGKVGMAKSRIVVLDALLKLRQVCCDPRLVSAKGGGSALAKEDVGIEQSAKLATLMEMIEELMNERRHVLVFSQFTSMLELIEAELAARNYKWAKLTGETVDRQAEVEKFQGGKVPIFLLSLKAGGVGLNLTAADTVIHYDPWWNPAAENQATDRAHRIGQDKPIFVYKLIAANSVEQKIMDMQKKKGDLAAMMLDGADAGWKALTSDDLVSLFS
ncbi:MAG: SNF2-related protein [bacterium]